MGVGICCHLFFEGLSLRSLLPLQSRCCLCSPEEGGMGNTPK